MSAPCPICERPTNDALCSKCARHEILREHFWDGRAIAAGWNPLRCIDDMAFEDFPPAGVETGR